MSTTLKADALGEGAHHYYMPELRELILRTVPVGGRLLEVGCGRGHFLSVLRSWGYSDVLGCDLQDQLDPEFHEFEFHPVDFSSGQLPLLDSSVDAVISLHVIEHLENPWHHVRELRRVLRPGGHLFIGYPTSKDLVSRFKFLLSADVPSFTRKNNHIAFFPQAVEEKLFDGFDQVCRLHAPRHLPVIGRVRLPGSPLWSHKSLTSYRRST
jgi:2-polyprenyl-3-methyl-5-hydroxy-6-metoxy-1,4-benzoquinol methylase